MANEPRIPIPTHDQKPDRMEPAWYELDDPAERVKLKKRQDARTEAWKRGEKAEPAHPEDYEGVRLTGDKAFSVWGRYPVPPKPKPVMTDPEPFTPPTTQDVAAEFFAELKPKRSAADRNRAHREKNREAYNAAQRARRAKAKPEPD